MIKKRIWTQQPQGAAQIDWSNPITRGLSFAVNPAMGAFDAVQQKYATTTNGLFSITKIGKELKASGTGKTAEFSINPILGSGGNGSGDVTLFAIANPFAEAREGCLIGSMMNGSPYTQIALYANFHGLSGGAESGTICFETYNGGNAGYANGGAVIDGSTRAFAGVARAGSKYVYVDGVNSTTSSFNGLSTFGANASSVISVGSESYNASTRASNANISFAAVWNRALTDVEIKSISENPWQIFRAPDSRIFVPIVGTSTATYTIYPTGSLVFNNNTPSIKTNILPTSGNISYTGTNNLIFSNGATTYTITPAGSIIYINSNILKRERVLYTTGNIIYSGTITAQHTRALSVNGLITYTGSATNIRIKLINPIGNITYTGTNPIYVPGSVVITTRLPLTGVGN